MIHITAFVVSEIANIVIDNPNIFLIKHLNIFQDFLFAVTCQGSPNMAVLKPYNVICFPWLECETNFPYSLSCRTKSTQHFSMLIWIAD